MPLLNKQHKKGKVVCESLDKTCYYIYFNTYMNACKKIIKIRIADPVMKYPDKNCKVHVHQGWYYTFPDVGCFTTNTSNINKET